MWNILTYCDRKFYIKKGPETIGAFFLLTHEDSNLERLDQNQLCCQLHHGSSIMWLQKYMFFFHAQNLFLKKLKKLFLSIINPTPCFI